jgi:hypothetical protein
MMPRPALDAHLTLLGWEPTLSDHGIMGFLWALYHFDTVRLHTWDHWTTAYAEPCAGRPQAAKTIEWSEVPDKILFRMAEVILT